MIKLSVEEFLTVYRFIDDLLPCVCQGADYYRDKGNNDAYVELSRDYEAFFKLWSAMTDYYYEVIDHE